MIDFTLSPAQENLRLAAQSFAKNVLSTAPAIYRREGTPDARFQSTRPLFAQGVKAGLMKGQIPAALGGTGGSLIDAAILVEEMYAIESSATLNLLGTGLGLSPVILAGSEEQKARFLKKFLEADGSLDGGNGTPMASFVFSEPEGVANWVEKGGKRMRTTARQEGNEWVINGEKIWATNCAGWDFKGADLQCVVCRRVVDGAPPAEDPRDDSMIIVVTREDIARNQPGAYSVLEHPELVGHDAVSGPHTRFDELHVPAANVLCPPGHGAAITEATFTGTAVLVGAMAVGLMRRSFDLALAFAKNDARGGSVPIMERQSVADLLINIKMRCEASRSLVWRAAYALEQRMHPELAYEAKVYCSDNAVQSAVDAMNAVGISSYKAKMEFGTIMNDAICLPIFDGGNVGIRRRQIQAIFAAKGYEPWEATYGPTAQ